MTSDAPKYINPLTDFGFKKLFGSEPNKALLIDLLNHIIPDRHIVDLTYSTNEHTGRTAFDRKAIFDIYCKGDDGDRFIVEMQKAKQNYFKDRSVFYASFLIQEQGQRKDWNYKLDTVYSIGILDFVFDDRKENQRVFHVVELKDQDGAIFYDKLKFIYIELPNFRKGESELATGFDRWCYFLRHLAELPSVPPVLDGPIFERAFAAAALARLSRGEVAAYESSLKVYRDLKNTYDYREEEGLRKGLEQGLEQGRKEGKAEGLKEGIAQRNRAFANALKSQGFSNDRIAETIGLSISEVESLLK